MSIVNTITLNFITKIIFKHIIWQPWVANTGA